MVTLRDIHKSVLYSGECYQLNTSWNQSFLDKLFVAKRLTLPGGASWTENSAWDFCSMWKLAFFLVFPVRSGIGMSWVGTKTKPKKKTKTKAVQFNFMGRNRIGWSHLGWGFVTYYWNHPNVRGESRET